MSFYREDDHPWLRANEFSDVRAEELLRKLDQAPASSRPRAWVFDLDSTLFCVGPRIRSSYLAFLRAHPQAPSEWHRVLPFLTSEVQRYSIEGTFRHILAQWNPPELAARKAHELWEAFHEPWKEKFFSDQFLHLDEAYPGAREFLEKVKASDREIVYLTGRDAPRTKAGTVAAIRMADFPRDESTHLFMKPDREMGDLDYKARATSILRERFEVEAVFDNEPENLVMFARELPRAEIVFFHSIMSLRVPHEDMRRLLGERKLLRLESFV